MTEAIRVQSLVTPSGHGRTCNRPPVAFQMPTHRQMCQAIKDEIKASVFSSSMLTVFDNADNLT